IKLGTDRMKAIQTVLDMLGMGENIGTISRLWEQYQDTPDWTRLADGTHDDYTQCSAKLLEVFGEMRASDIRAPDIARYLRVERKAAPVRANREVALLSNLINLAIERGEAEANPCRQVRRNTERPRTHVPERAAFAAFLAWLAVQSPQRKIIGVAA